MSSAKKLTQSELLILQARQRTTYLLVYLYPYLILTYILSFECFKFSDTVSVFGDKLILVIFTLYFSNSTISHKIQIGHKITCAATIESEKENKEYVGV